MKNLSRENILLLAVMLSSSIGAFSYFPYVSTALVDYLGLPNFSISSVIAFGMFAGNTIAYVICLRVDEPRVKPLLSAGYAMALLAVASIAFARFLPVLAACAVVAGSITVYRFAIGLSANLSRALQIRYLPRREEKLQVFSYIKLCSGIAGALGPLVGSIVIERWGFSGILMLSSACFASALLMLAFVRQPAPSPVHEKPDRSLGLWGTLRSQPPMVVMVAVTALLHFIFEAQIYSSISINIRNNEKSYVDLIALLFATNAILLIVLVIPVLKLVNSRLDKFMAVALGSLFSLISIVYSLFAHTAVDVVVIAALFTIGEIITPQVMIDMATDGDAPQASVGAIATFNFLTSGVGMSLGFWLGGLIPSLNNPVAGGSVWLCIYLAFVALARYCTTRARQGAWKQASASLSG